MISIFLKYRKLLLVALCLVIGLLIFKVSSVRLNAGIAGFFPKNDTTYAIYEQVKKEFKNKELIIVVGIERKSETSYDVFNGLVVEFADDIQSLENIEEVNGLHTVRYPVRSMFGTMAIPYVNVDSVGIDLKKNKIIEDKRITQNFINQDFSSQLLYLEIKPDLDIEQRRDLLESIKRFAYSYDSLNFYFWGRDAIDLAFQDKLREEIELFSVLILLLLILSILFIFQRPRAILLPLSVFIAVMIIFLGGLGLIDHELGTMSNLFPTIILIVGVSDVIHMAIKYQIDLKGGAGKWEAINSTFKEIGWAIFITSFTTAVGFASLFIYPMSAMRSFAIESASIVLLTYLVTLILASAYFYYLKPKIFELRPVFVQFYNLLRPRILWCINNPRKIVLIYSCLFILGILGITQIDRNAKEYSMPKNGELYRSYDFFERQFSGSRSFEMVLSSTDDGLLTDQRSYQKMVQIDSLLRKSEPLKHVRSPLDSYWLLHKAYNSRYDGVGEVYLSQGEIDRYTREIKQSGIDDYLWNRERSKFKFEAQMADIGRLSVKAFNLEIQDRIDDIIGDAPIKATLTGMDNLIDASHILSINKMSYGLLLVTLVVGITLGLILRSVALALLSILMNIIPVVISAGFMGLFNLELRGETVLIFTIGFVIAIDDTVHLLSKYKMERKKGSGTEEALLTALDECGKAIFATSIILFGGFMVLLISDSPVVFSMGLVITIMVIVTLSVDMLLIPAIILKYFRKYT